MVCLLQRHEQAGNPRCDSRIRTGNHARLLGEFLPAGAEWRGRASRGEQLIPLLIMANVPQLKVNPNFNSIEFDGIEKQVVFNSYKIKYQRMGRETRR